MARPNDNAMMARFTVANSALATGLRTALRERQWTVLEDSGDGEDVQSADILVMTDIHAGGAGSARAASARKSVNAAIKAGIRRIVLISDVSLYDASTRIPLRETTPLVPNAKSTPPDMRAALGIEADVGGAEGIEHVILRIPRLYDPDDPTALTELRTYLQQGAVEDENLLFQRLHPADLAEAVHAAARRPEAAGEVFNIAEPMAIAGDTLAAELARLGRLLTDPEATADRVRPEYRLAQPRFATDKAARMLEFRPRRSMWSGLAECTQAIIRDLRIKGELPAGKPKLPPLIEALETGSRVLRGQVCVVTGATDGIGREVSVMLARCGATVVAIGDDSNAGDALLAELRDRPCCTEGAFHRADPAGIHEARRIAADILRDHPRINALINASARVFERRQMTSEGVEATFATNHLAPFQLTLALIDAIPRDGHIVNLGSELHRNSGIDFSDLYCTRAYHPMDAFARAKFAAMMFSNSLASRSNGSGPRILTVSPGLDPALPPPRWQGGLTGPSPQGGDISPHKAASHIAGVLVDARLNALSGIYLDQDKQVAMAPETGRPAACARMWHVSEALLDIV